MLPKTEDTPFRQTSYVDCEESGETLLHRAIGDLYRAFYRLEKREKYLFMRTLRNMLDEDMRGMNQEVYAEAWGVNKP